MVIKKWSGTAWVDQYVTTNVANIVASGTASSTTFLRGDGQWATPIDTNTNNYVSSASFDGSTLTLNRQGLTALTVDLSSLAGGGGSGYGLKLSGTITANQTLESLFEGSYDTNGIDNIIGSYWVVTAATANVTFITTAQTHGSPTIYYCLIGDYFEENDGTGQFTLERHDWLMITSYTGSGTSGSPYIVKFSVLNNTYTTATATQYGIVKFVSNTAQTVAANSLSTTAGRTYAVQKDSNGDMVVNVPWTDTDTNTTYAQATSSTLGLVKIGFTESGKDYPVELNASGQMFVNVPWTDTDTNTTYSAGTGLVLSGTTFSANLIDSTLRSVTANAITTTANRTYAVMPDADGDLVVNVPWTDTDTNTTYSAGTGLSLTGTTFANTAPDQTVALTGAGSVSISGTYPNFTITGTDTNTTYGIATSTTAGLVELFSNTDQTVAANAVTATAGRTYGIQLNAANQMVVNVPWTDTNTTYSAGTGLSLSGTTFTNTAPDQTVTLTGSGATSVSGTYPNFTISSTDTNTTYGLAGTATSGLVRLGATAANVTVNSASTTAGRYYPVGASTSGNLYVNVPWVDTNTTYSLGSFGITSTAAELNVLDGITATTTELNYTDGVTSNIQTQLNGKLSLSGGTMTGVITTPNGTHGIIVGDDSRLADRNVANTLFVEGVQNTDRGYINFSSTTGNALGAINGGNLTWRGTSVSLSGHGHSASEIVSGTLGVSRGGTGATTFTSGNVLVGAGTGAVTTLSRSGIDSRSSFPPSGHDLNFHSDVSVSSPVSGQVLKWNGTAWTNQADANTDTNNYLTGVSGSGNGTVTFTRTGLSNLTWNASHTHSNYLPIPGSPYYSPVANSILQYNTTYGWITTAKHYDWNLIRNHTGTSILDNTNALGTTSGSASLTTSISAGDVLMMELSPFQSVIAGYTLPVVIVRLGGTDTTPTSTTQTVLMWTERLNSTTFYEYVVKVSASGSTLYFDDSFRRSYVDTSTASSIIVEANNGCFIGKVWRLEI